ncbi:hypothetical protein HYT56_03105 [Candidatus Woesearchaeota archaeon]|nr:hypothetical protein [Candidatus Woesearchaeota archaeon]
MNKEKNEESMVGSPVLIVYEHDKSKKEIGVLARIESNNYVFSSVYHPGREIYVSRRHAEIHPLSEDNETIESRL